MYISRDFQKIANKIIDAGRVLMIYGSRQTGKTTLVEEILKAKRIRNAGIVRLNGDIKPHRDMLTYESMTVEKARMRPFPATSETN